MKRPPMSEGLLHEGLLNCKGYTYSGGFLLLYYTICFAFCQVFLRTLLSRFARELSHLRPASSVPPAGGGVSPLLALGTPRPQRPSIGEDSHEESHAPHGAATAAKN